MRDKRIRKRGIFSVLILLIIVFTLLGPQPKAPLYNPNFPVTTLGVQELSDSIDLAETANKTIKTNNQARIIWADSSHLQTEWAIVYLHGFSASQMEGNPVHEQIANKYGMNLYLARLSDHGLNSDSALFYLTPDRLWNSAKKALMIGSKLGKRIILMSTSTGGTLALKLAEEYPDKIAALINYSPNIRINNPLAWMLNNPWGKELLRLKSGDYINTAGANDSIVSQYWNTHYRIEALPQLEELVETTMTKEVFERIKCPSLTIAYYKDEDHQDPTVKVSAMKWMHTNLGTYMDKKRFVELPNAGVHPLASGLRSQDLGSVIKETNKFIVNVLGIREHRGKSD